MDNHGIVTIFVAKTGTMLHIGLAYSFPQRKLENEALCVEYGCSYTKDGSPDKVFCFKEGQYQTEAGEECPTEATGIYQALAKVYIC